MENVKILQTDRWIDEQQRRENKGIKKAHFQLAQVSFSLQYNMRYLNPKSVYIYALIGLINGKLKLPLSVVNQRSIGEDFRNFGK